MAILMWIKYVKGHKLSCLLQQSGTSWDYLVRNITITHIWPGLFLIAAKSDVFIQWISSPTVGLINNSILHLHSSRSCSCCISLSSCSSIFCFNFPVSDFPREAILCQNTILQPEENGKHNQIRWQMWLIHDIRTITCHVPGFIPYHFLFSTVCSVFARVSNVYLLMYITLRGIKNLNKSIFFDVCNVTRVWSWNNTDAT